MLEGYTIEPEPVGGGTSAPREGEPPAERSAREDGPPAQRSAGSPTFDLLPAIDLRGGRVVRLVCGDFARELAYSDDPVAVAEKLVSGGARWLHVVDLGAVRDPSSIPSPAIAAIIDAVAGRAAVEVAGGLRDPAVVAAVLASGASRAVVGTLAIRDPEGLRGLLATHGPQRIVVALDVRDGQAVGEGWRIGARGVPVLDLVGRLRDVGAAVFEATAIERDGTLAGPDLGLLASLVAATGGSVIASAGIRSATDIAAVRALGCAGAIVGRALYDGVLSLEDALAAARGAC